MIVIAGISRGLHVNRPRCVLQHPIIVRDIASLNLMRGSRRSPVKIWRKSKIHALNLPLCVRDVFLATRVSQKNSHIKYIIQQEKTIQPDCYIEARDALQLLII
jgi:hypothetical protein